MLAQRTFAKHSSGPGKLVKLSYDILQDPDAKFVFDGSDQMPGEVGAGALFTQLTAWIAANQATQTTLDNVEAAWPAS